MHRLPLKRNYADWIVAGSFLAGRICLLFLLPYSLILGFGDLLNFYRLAELPGWPFFDYWVEFPPFFPFLSAGLYRLAGGNEFFYVHLLIVIFSIADAGSILVFGRLLQLVKSPAHSRRLLIIHSAVLFLFPFGWWYFDPITVFFLLVSIFFALTNKPVGTGLFVAAGFLWKAFPILALIPAWMTMKRQKFLIALVISIAGIVAVFGILNHLSPRFTQASLVAQSSKGSWETIWSLFDGNLGTGNFGPLTDRLEPAKASISFRNPAVIPPVIPLIIAGFIGFVVLMKTTGSTFRQRLVLTTFAWILLILASPGWSPQWILYIIPMIFLILPDKQAVLLVILLIGLSLAEWPVLISRGRLDLLTVVIVLRTVLFLGLAVFCAIDVWTERKKPTDYAGGDEL